LSWNGNRWLSDEGEWSAARISKNQTVVGRRTIMKPSTEDRTEGKLHEVKGKIKEEVGKATNNPDLEVSGNAEKNAGKVQKWIGRGEKAVGE
jgi:uncharacterized protein YjbJ (UPF0337 family)